jgi:inositol phosphorylceramide mannosyltransferase catalytic subunit
MRISIIKLAVDALVPRIPMGDGIPKVIFQTYDDSSKLTDTLIDNIEYLKKSNPDWQYRLFGDTEVNAFIKCEYPALLSFYQQISPVYGAAKADFFRYLLIYRYGGVYLDIKSTISKPLSSTIKSTDRFLLSNWHEWRDQPGYKGWGQHGELAHIEGGEFQQWYIVSVAGHPYLREVILAVLRNIVFYHPRWSGIGKLGVLRTTGPIAYTLAIASAQQDYHREFVNIKSDYGFEYSIFEKDVHLGLFAQHYSKGLEPVICKGRTGTLFSYVIGFMKKLRRKIYYKIGI